MDLEIEGAAFYCRRAYSFISPRFMDRKYKAEKSYNIFSFKK